MNIYVASSWRNESRQQAVVKWLRRQGHNVYDFINPRPEERGFSWDHIDHNWWCWSIDEYRAALKAPIAKAGSNNDLCGMEWADVFILANPSGRSAHMEAGRAIGKCKPTAIILCEED